ncbi:LamG-like jellyroll fold domain-containing protein [Sorangium sp. So ce1014]|uniref:LamG-like jellyroll fold domain-containing protein n=1 Tax=Sorangium sp. So ce1014 TaxID=3133326 RepID=UPI003F6363D8
MFEAEPFVTFSDNFEDGNLNGWDQSYAGFTVATDGANKVLTYSYSNSNAKLFPQAVNWKDSSVEARIKIPSWSGAGSVGLNARYNIHTLDRYTFMYKSTGELEIAVRDNDVVVSSVSKSLTLTPGTWHTFEALVEGTSLELYVDGNLELSTTGSPRTSTICPSPNPDQRRRLAPPLPHPGIASPPAGAAGIPGHIGRMSSWHC